MSLRTALRLYAIHASTAEFGDRLRPHVIKQGETLPAATMMMISSAVQDTLAGPTNHQNDRVQFDVYADDSEDVGPLAKKLLDRLVTAYGLLPISSEADPETIDITGVSIASGIRDVPAEDPVNGSDVWRYRCTFDLFVSYNS